MNLIKYLKIERNKGIIIFFLIFSVLVFLSASIFIDGYPTEGNMDFPCDGGIGCIGLLPFVIVAYPAMPALHFIAWLVYHTSYPFAYGLSSTTSFFKFVPPIILLSYIFTLGFLISYLAIKIRSQKDSKEEQKIKFRNVKKTFLVYYAVCAAGMIILLFNSAPPAPFATKASILDGCHGSADCRESFLSYELKNCDGQTSFFLYPLKTSSLKADQCMFDNFILQKPLKDIPKYSNVDPGNVDVAIKFFDDQLKVSTDKKKSDFCKSFSDSVYVEKSNQVYCFISLEMVDDWTSETLKSVCTLVLTEYDWKDGYIKDICINKILDFDVYFIDDTLLNNLFGIKKWSYRMYGPRFGDHTGEFIYRVSLRTDVALEGNSDDFMIMQSSVSGGLYQHFLQSISTTNFDFRYNDYLNNNNNYDILTNVTNTRKIKINDVDVYIQDIEEIRDNKVLREYINLNFVKGNTYVLIDGQRYGENNRNDVFIKIAEAIIKQ